MSTWQWIAAIGYPIGAIITLVLGGLVTDNDDAEVVFIFALLWPVVGAAALVWLVCYGPIALGQWLRDR